MGANAHTFVFWIYSAKRIWQQKQVYDKVFQTTFVQVEIVKWE